MNYWTFRQKNNQNIKGILEYYIKISVYGCGKQLRLSIIFKNYANYIRSTVKLQYTRIGVK